MSRPWKLQQRWQKLLKEIRLCCYPNESQSVRNGTTIGSPVSGAPVVAEIRKVVLPRRDKSEYKRMPPEPGTERFRIEVGYTHGVKPGNIVGAISNEAGLDS